MSELITEEERLKLDRLHREMNHALFVLCVSQGEHAGKAYNAAEQEYFAFRYELHLRIAERLQGESPWGIIQKIPLKPPQEEP